jgi:hypothetical protein
MDNFIFYNMTAGYASQKGEFSMKFDTLLIEYLCTEAEMSVGLRLLSNAPLSGRAVSFAATGARRSDVTDTSPHSGLQFTAKPTELKLDNGLVSRGPPQHCNSSVPATSSPAASKATATVMPQ